MANVEQLFSEYMKRRDGLLKALTTESATLYQRCNPQTIPLLLYGNADGTWELSTTVKTDLPQPIPVNPTRKIWMRELAEASQIWLLSVATLLCLTFKLNNEERSRLFFKIGNMPDLASLVDPELQQYCSTLINWGAKRTRIHRRRWDECRKVFKPVGSSRSCDMCMTELRL